MNDGKCFNSAKVDNLSILDPSMARDHSFKHENHLKVVYADTDFLLPILLALSSPIDDSKKMGLQISSRTGEIIISSSENNITFDESGYVYILDKSKFNQTTKPFGTEVQASEIVDIENKITITPKILLLMQRKGLIVCNIPIES